VFCTPSGTPLNKQNLYNRVLAPACDRINQPSVSWHTFRNTHATLLTEVGESIKTAQALLGHSDLGATLNTYAHVIRDSQRRAVERVAGVLFSSVLEFEENSQGGKANRAQRQHLEMSWWARQDLNLGPTDYESAALTAELRAPRNAQIILDLP